ncbi:MAG TPA: glycosyltransferase family 4 protein, partial [Pyrinomonadaceae bacterium]|nr:glycosyltransferase family 4 protein [Pyrinomonadaceae bacterium]
DQKTICLALPQFFKSTPNAHFVFAGGAFSDSQHLLDECVNICRDHDVLDRVHFLGKRSDVSNILHSLDIYVQSSTNESQGIAVVEAMLAGLPVIVSDIGALREVTGNGTCGAVFKAGDSDGLAKTLIELAAATTRRHELGKKGQEHATANYSIAAHLAALRNLYSNLLARSD